MVVLSKEGGDLAVFDRANRRNISEYFKAFLGVKRLYSAEDATKRLSTALTNAFVAHQVDAPADIRRSWRSKFYEATRERDIIEPEGEFDIFGAAIFGPFWENADFRQTVDDELQRQKISGEAIEIHKNSIRRPNIRRIKTVEDVIVRYPEDLRHVVTVAKGDGGRATITIQTQGIIDDEFVDENAYQRPRRGH